MSKSKFPKETDFIEQIWMLKILVFDFDQTKLHAVNYLNGTSSKDILGEQD